LSTTLDTPREVRRAVYKDNPNRVWCLPEIAMVIHRPDKVKADYDGLRVISLVEKEIQAWDPENKDCPYCKVGSIAYEPKTNWGKLIV